MPVMKQDRLALDRASMRTFDDDGHMRVASCRISKSNVCEYLGSEIPGHDDLGLKQDGVYRLWRHPDSLAASAESMNGKPLTLVHRAQTASDHSHEIVAGSLSNTRWEPPYLVADLVIWDGDAIKLVQDKERRELSCAYFYQPVMESGTTPDGDPYDLVMRDLRMNHCALVENGRAGPDVYVADSAPLPLETTPEPVAVPDPTPLPPETRRFPSMANTRAKPLSRCALYASGATSALMAGKMAEDAKMDVDSLFRGVTAKNWKTSKPKVVARLNKAAEGKLAQDADLDDVVDMLDRLDDVTDELDDADQPLAIADPNDAPADDDGDLISKVKALTAGATPAEIEALIAALKPADTTPVAAGDADTDDDDDAPAKDAEPKVTKAAMDAAISAAVKMASDNAERKTIARLRAIADAEKEVRPFIGELAMAQDSAAAVYKLALDHAEVDLTGVPPEAYRAMVRMLQKPDAVAPAVRVKVAMDSKLDADLAQKFPGLNSLKQR